jgi:hypothetical protein
MTEKFQKPFIPRPGILKETPGDPEGYVTKDGMWAAVPFGKKFIIIHNGHQVHVGKQLQIRQNLHSKVRKRRIGFNFRRVYW